jgi:cytochrome c oxidase assembly protein subunit 11
MGIARQASDNRPHAGRRDELARNNRALVTKLVVIVVAMFGFGYALVPLYEKICQVTGVRNIDQADAVTNSQVDAGRSVRIEFDTNVRNLPWRFRAVDAGADVHPGAVTQAMFEVVNTSDHPVTGQAIPSYGPREAAQYFRKLDCFCFAKQTLAAGETRRMPVVFVVDPSLPKDVPTITLSYTFFEVEGTGSVANTGSDADFSARKIAPGATFAQRKVGSETTFPNSAGK